MKKDRLLNRSDGIVLKFSALMAASLFLWWGSLTATFQLASHDDAYTYILLILPLSLALIYFEPKQLVELAPSGKKAGWIGLTLALLLHTVIARGVVPLSPAQHLCVDMFALVMWWLAGAVVCLSFDRIRYLFSPLCFLLLIVPLPEGMMGRITELLQYQSAVAVTGLFRVAMVPVVRNGILVSIPALDLEVARECSSIRSSILLLIASLVFAHLFVQSWWGKLIVVVAALPLAVAKNALRIFTIAELGTRVDPGYLNGRLHHDGGIIFFGLAVTVSFSLATILRRIEFAGTRRATIDSRKPS